MTALRVATFNIQHARRPDRRIDVPALGRAVAGFEADVVGLQEVDVRSPRSRLSDMPASVGAATGMASAFGRSRLLPFGGCYGNALLVRGTIDDVEVVVLPGRPDGRPTERRTVLVAGAVVDDGVVSVGVCHLGLEDDEAKGQLAFAFDVLARRPGPRVLLGDWNLWRPEVEPIVAAAGFDLAPAGPTFPVGNPRKTIDHVAVDGFEVVGSEVVAAPVSDHRALLVDLRREG